MKDLDQKYRDDSLSDEELSKLRDCLNSDKIQTVENAMREYWMSDDIDISQVNDTRINAIKAIVDSKIHNRDTSLSRTAKIIMAAASLMLPIFIAISIYLYIDRESSVNEEMIVSTGPGEKACIILPDKSKVTMNYSTWICYNPNTYNQEKREVRFNGEAYFEICKRNECPFYILSSDCKVKVLGTTFNISARTTDLNAKLTLETGMVMLTSLKTGEEVILKPRQTAILNYATGKIVVTTNLSITSATSWTKGDLAFKNLPFKYVIKKIEEAYAVKIRLNASISDDDLFTGTLPASSLNEALEIIEKSYNIKAIIEDDQITFTNLDAPSSVR